MSPFCCLANATGKEYVEYGKRTALGSESPASSWRYPCVVCLYTHIHVILSYTCMCTCVYMLYLYVCMYVCIYLQNRCVHVHVHIGEYVCMYVFVM